MLSNLEKGINIKMIFPMDVYKKALEQRKIAGENKIQLIITVFILANLACFFGLNYVFNMYLGVGIKAALLTQSIICIILGIFVFRFLIFKEDDKIREYKGYNSDSFARFLFLRKDVQNDVMINRDCVNVFEYDNGSSTCTFEFRFGSNDIAKANNTRKFFEDVFKICSDYNFECRTISSSEDFESSNEFRAHVEELNKMEQSTLAHAIMLMTDAIMQESIRVCNVDMIYLTIRTQTNYQRKELEACLRRIILKLESTLTAFRSVRFLSMEELLEFYRNFYCIEAIDLGMMKSIEMARELDDDFSRVVGLVSLLTTDKKSYLVNKKMNKIFKSDERRFPS